jgi:hypothetical protein
MPSSLVIEAWVNPLSALTPSLVVHNLELQGIQLPQQPFTVTIDRGHYDCSGTNYAVIVVSASSAATNAIPSSVYCSFFSHSVTRDTDPGALYPHWLGNCYVHFGHNREALCSYRHEAGRTKTWNLAESGSVDPVSNTKKKTRIQIVQLQKKALLLRTELDAWKAEVRDLKTELMALKAELGTVKAELGTVKADQVGLAQRRKEQEAWANPFDFKEICDYADMPALDLIATHYQCASNNANANANANDSSDSDSDDDCFIQVVVEK